jgi:ElaB/YqjD/DUF883 family membrane-anchored ribosome-binding protein
MSNTNVSHLQNATEQLGLARDHITVGVADAVNSGVDAARELKNQASESFDDLLDQGKDIASQAADVIRSRPWAVAGVALAAGYVLSKFFRGRG